MRTHSLQLLAYAALSSSAMALPIYAASVGASYRVIGLIGAAVGLSTVISETLFGRLGDRIDRRRLLVTGFAAAAAAYGLQYFADDPATLLFVRFLVGFCAGMIPATLAAYVYEIKRPLGKFTSFNAMGWLIGSTLVIGAGALTTCSLRFPVLESARRHLVAFGPFELLFLTSAALCGLGWFLARDLKPMKVRIEAPMLPTRVFRSNLHVYVPMFLRHLGATTIWVVFPLYIVQLGGGLQVAGCAGADLSFVGWLHVLNMVTQILVLRSAEGFRVLSHPRVLIAIGLVLSAAAFFGFSLASNAPQIMPLQVLAGASFACLWLGSLKEVLQSNVERATATGLLNATLGLSNVAGPVLGGFVAAVYGIRATMVVGSLITVVGLIFFLLPAGRRRGQEPEKATVVGGPTGEVVP